MEPEGKKSFWTSVTGILTAVAAVVTAGGGIAALVVGTGGSKSSSSSGAGDGGAKVTVADWAEKANEICQSAYDDIRALGIPNEPNAQFQAIPQLTMISTRANQKLQALDRPDEANAKITQLLSAASQASVSLNNAYNAYRNGDAATAQSEFQQAKESTQELQRIDGELGANVCARGP